MPGKQPTYQEITRLLTRAGLTPYEPGSAGFEVTGQVVKTFDGRGDLYSPAARDLRDACARVIDAGGYEIRDERTCFVAIAKETPR